MKKFAFVLLIIGFACAAAVVVPFILKHRSAAEHGGRSEPGATEKAGDEKKETEHAESGIKIDKATQERLALETKALEEAKMTPQIVAYGWAIDPAPLASLHGDLAAADAALHASEAGATRARSLFQSGETVARKAVETAEAQYEADRGRAQALQRKLRLEWGGAIASMSAAERGVFLDRLINEQAAIVRADVPGGESVKEAPKSARIVVLGRDDAPIAAKSVAPAGSIDPKAQAQGFLIQVEEPPFPVRPGVAVTASLELPGEESDGVILPRSAIVRYAGETWVYVQTKEEEFERRRAPKGELTEKGLFVGEGFKRGEKVVTVGAQSVLATELAPQSEGSAD